MSDATDAAYFRAQKVLDEFLGPDESDGAGEGLAADVRLVGQQRNEARAALAALQVDVLRIAKKLKETPTCYLNCHATTHASAALLYLAVERPS